MFTVYVGSDLCYLQSNFTLGDKSLEESFKEELMVCYKGALASCEASRAGTRPVLCPPNYDEIVCDVLHRYWQTSSPR